MVWFLTQYFSVAAELKNVLIVYAHQSSKSFNASAKEAAKKTLEATGCTVDVSDLYSLVAKGVAGNARASQTTPAVNFSRHV